MSGNVHVVQVCDQNSPDLAAVARKCGLEGSLGGYISVVIATHLSLMKKPTTMTQLREMQSMLTIVLKGTIAESVERLAAVVKQRRMDYYLGHRREFVPESVEEDLKARSPSNSPNRLSYGKYDNRIRLSEYLAAPLTEADMTFILCNCISMHSKSIAHLRKIRRCYDSSLTISSESSYLSDSAAGDSQSQNQQILLEEERVALINQRAFFGAGGAFVETAEVRTGGEIELGSTGIGNSAHKAGCGLYPFYQTVNSHCLRQNWLTETLCRPWLIDVGSNPQVGISDFGTAVMPTSTAWGSSSTTSTSYSSSNSGNSYGSPKKGDSQSRSRSVGGSVFFSTTSHSHSPSYKSHGSPDNVRRSPGGAYSGSGSRGRGETAADRAIKQQWGHYTCGIPLLLADGFKVLCVFESVARTLVPSKEGMVHQQEKLLAEGIAQIHNHNADSNWGPRQCKLCGAVHSGTMHQEFNSHKVEHQQSQRCSC